MTPPPPADAVLRLRPERVFRRYRGGSQLAALRGASEPDDLYPEDWIASDTVAKDGGESGHEGLARTVDGRFVRDVLAADPEHWLGAAHVARFGTHSAVLVKLLDPVERLPVHAHPDAAFAQRHLDHEFGKSEAWVVVGTRDGGPATVWLGARHDVDQQQMLDWIDRQDRSALIGCLNELQVAPGDVLFVPGGVPHSIGGGVLLLEVQEPTDWSIHIEQAGFATRPRDTEAMGLPWSTAIDALVLDRFEPTLGFPDHARSLFGIDSELQPGTCNVVVATGGSGTVAGQRAGVGDTFLVAAAVAGEVPVTGDLELVCCTPPRP